MDPINSSENDEDSLVHYETGAFIKTYKEDGAVYYASFHEELYPEDDGLDGTGRYLVVLLQPSGLSHFYMIPEEDKWIPSDEHFSAIAEGDADDSTPDNTESERKTPTMQLDLLISAGMLAWLSDVIINHNA